ncbi:MAG: dihydroneopterin aldolase [Candidatus Bipolaricaulota bacterium]|nr:dihydroneopterin aldolase [Candidatus Bipolaricaulota bacterium]MDW8140665.1 dihydroneopterin aldolase [Candidatus Bipolaricaulota bacterium]
MMGRLMIEGVQLFGHHGATQEERERGQLFSLDLELELDFPSQDDLAHTVDYVRVIEIAQRVNQDQSFQLLESFARVVAEEVLSHLSPVRRVRVRVCKGRPPLPPGMHVESVAAEVVRGR